MEIYGCRCSMYGIRGFFLRLCDYVREIAKGFVQIKTRLSFPIFAISSFYLSVFVPPTPFLSHTYTHIHIYTLSVFLFSTSPSSPSLSRFSYSGLVHTGLGYKSKQLDKNIPSIQKCFPPSSHHWVENFTSRRRKNCWLIPVGCRGMDKWIFADLKKSLSYRCSKLMELKIFYCPRVLCTSANFQFFSKEIDWVAASNF